MSRSSVVSAIAGFLLLAATAALPQDYPAKPVVIIVPAAAGGPTDTLTRVLAAAMGEALKQQMIIDNSGGAGGTIGINKAAKARADGYTLLLYHIGMSTAPALYRKLPYDTLSDFDYIGQVADVPMTLVAKKGTAATAFPEFLAYIKANRDKVTYAQAGIGSASYLCGLLFMTTIDTQFTQVPYKGTGPAMNDLVGGQVDFMCDQTTNTTSQIKAEKIKVYGVTTRKRLASLPNVPTMDEAGLKGFEVSVWHGFYAPKGTPKPVIDKLTNALHVALKDDNVKQRFAELGTEPVAENRGTPAALRAHLKAEIDKWSPIIKKAGVYAD
jgi:tripartite-type tricarboxylate transporter receptor subunit TctC